jgi:hypothetical protein
VCGFLEMKHENSNFFERKLQIMLFSIEKFTIFAIEKTDNV